MTELLIWLREAVTQNVGLKLLSLLLAVLIHVVVQRDSVREAMVAVPITVVGVAKSQVFTSDLPEEAKLRVRGRWGGIRELQADRTARLVIDVAQFRSGERFVFDHRTVEQQLPSRHVEVLGVDPPSVEVRMELLEQKQLPVEPVVSGDPAPGLRLAVGGVTAEPARVDVSGPTSEMRTLRAVRTVPFDLAGTDNDIHTTVRLAAPPGRHVRLGVEEVMLNVKLEELPVSRMLANQPVAVRGCPADSRCVVEPPEISVRVEGLSRAVSTFLARPPDNLVYADIGAALQQGQRVVTLSVNAVKGLVLTPEPGIARFNLTIDNPSAIPAPATADK